MAEVPELLLYEHTLHVKTWWPIKFSPDCVSVFVSLQFFCEALWVFTVSAASYLPLVANCISPKFTSPNEFRLLGPIESEG